MSDAVISKLRIFTLCSFCSSACHGGGVGGGGGGGPSRGGHVDVVDDEDDDEASGVDDDDDGDDVLVGLSIFTNVVFVNVVPSASASLIVVVVVELGLCQLVALDSVLLAGSE